MEFDKSRCYSAINADELRAGDKVVVADNFADLKKFVRKNDVHEIEDILSDCVNERFGVCGMANYALAYLVERAENCTNCGKTECSAHSEHDDFKVAVCSNWIPKAEPKTEQKAEKHFRPFKDTDELIKVWEQKSGCGHFYEGCLNLPHIWLRNKNNKGGVLITGFTTLLGASAVEVGSELHTMDYLAEFCEFLDGTPCGVVEDINTNVESTHKEKMLRDAASAKSDATNTAYQGQKTFRINCTEN